MTSDTNPIKHSVEHRQTYRVCGPFMILKVIMMSIHSKPCHVVTKMHCLRSQNPWLKPLRKKGKAAMKALSNDYGQTTEVISSHKLWAVLIPVNSQNHL